MNTVKGNNQFSAWMIFHFAFFSDDLTCYFPCNIFSGFMSLMTSILCLLCLYIILTKLGHGDSLGHIVQKSSENMIYVFQIS